MRTLEARQIKTTDDDFIVADVLIADGALTLANSVNDFSRPLTVTVTDGDSSISAGTVTIVGIDDRGDAVSEVVTLPTTGTSTQTTTAFFKEITSATVADAAGNGAGDNIKIGVNNTVQIMEQVGVFGGVTVNTTAAGTITITDQDSKSSLSKTIGTLKASITEGDYLMKDTAISRGLRIVLGADSVVTVFYNRSTSN